MLSGRRRRVLISVLFSKELFRVRFLRKIYFYIPEVDGKLLKSPHKKNVFSLRPAEDQHKSARDFLSRAHMHTFIMYRARSRVGSFKKRRAG